MELMDLLQSRRAFREYDDQPLTSEELQPILLAAETSPVGLGKYHNHRLTVIQDPKVLKQIQNIYQAPTLIVVSSPTRVSWSLSMPESSCITWSWLLKMKAWPLTIIWPA
jgi:nitroreductase